MHANPAPHATPRKKPPPPLWARGCGCLVVLVLGVVAVGVAASVLQGGGIGTGGGGASTIRVSGDPGTAFRGNYGTLNSDGSSTQKSVDGTVPASYQVSGSIVSAVFQKQSGGAETLTVEIVRDGTVVKEADTHAAYGTVSVATQ